MKPKESLIAALQKLGEAGRDVTAAMFDWEEENPNNDLNDHCCNDFYPFTKSLFEITGGGADENLYEWCRLTIESLKKGGEHI